MSPSTRPRRSKSSLAILEQAYRGSLEEQYGHIVWLSRVMKGMGAEHALLLKGDTVMFAISQTPRVTLQIGDNVVEGISHYPSSVSDLLAQGVPVHVWSRDLERLRIATEDLVQGVGMTSEADMPTLIQKYDCVWYW